MGILWEATTSTKMRCGNRSILEHLVLILKYLFHLVTSPWMTMMDPSINRSGRPDNRFGVMHVILSRFSFLLLFPFPFPSASLNMDYARWL